MDDSFKRPGEVPFKWEIRPGTPKRFQHPQEQYKPKPTFLTPPPAASSPLSRLSTSGLTNNDSDLRRQSLPSRFVQPLNQSSTDAITECFTACWSLPYELTFFKPKTKKKLAQDNTSIQQDLSWKTTSTQYQKSLSLLFHEDDLTSSSSSSLDSSVVSSPLSGPR